MELTQAQNDLIGPLVDETVYCLKIMAGLNAVPGKSIQVDPASFSMNDYLYVVETEGSVSGRVVMHYHLDASLEIGNRIRAVMLGGNCEDVHVIDEEIIEALSELSNTIVGRAANKLYDDDSNVQFRPPQYIPDAVKHEELKTGVQQILSVPVEVENIGKFHLNYLIQKISKT